MSERFHTVTTAVIGVNLAVAVGAYLNLGYEEALDKAETACWVFFCVEMACKMRGGRAFWRSKWNLFDLSVIALAGLPMLLAGVDLSVMRVARLARLARLVHLGKHLAGLRALARLGVHAVQLATRAHWRLTQGDAILVIENGADQAVRA
jgi:hypothetical protein